MTGLCHAIVAGETESVHGMNRKQTANSRVARVTTEQRREKLPLRQDTGLFPLHSISPKQFDSLVEKLTENRLVRDRTGVVIWITGLSGAGKTTVAHRLVPMFVRAQRPCVILDGDVIRDLVSKELRIAFGHDREQRLWLALLYGRLCQAVAARGLDVLCATVSMFHEVRNRNRTQIPGYLEVYLRVPVDELRRRDPKGLYARSAAGHGVGMVGVNVVAEEPRHADLVIDHAPDRTPDDTAEEIWRLIHKTTTPQSLFSR